MSCSANIQTIINKQKELIDTIDKYNYYVFCKKVGDGSNIGVNSYNFDDYDSDDEAINSDHKKGTYKLYNEWPQSLIDI